MVPRQESMSRGLKPNLLICLNVQAKAWTYLRSKSKSNGKSKNNGKSKYGGSSLRSE
jgi:hypothetical protein